MANKTEIETTTERLKEWYPEGSTVYTILRHRSQSGMQRVIGLVSLVEFEGEIIDRHPNFAAAEVLGRRVSKDYDGVVCRGAGMDMGFELAYSLAQKLYGDGYALKQRWL